MVALWFSRQQSATLLVNGQRFGFRTAQESPTTVLDELGIEVMDADLVNAPSHRELGDVEAIELLLARRVMIVHDGSVTEVSTQSSDAAGALADARIAVSDSDQLFLGRTRIEPTSPLPQPQPPTEGTLLSWVAHIRHPIQFTVRRAVPVTVQDGLVRNTIYTTSRRVGEALHSGGIPVYLGDAVFPALATEITPFMNVIVSRSKLITLAVGGTERMLRTRESSVGSLLESERLDLGPQDYVVPDLDAPMAQDLRIDLVRVHEEHYIEEVPIAHETRWEPSAAMEIDHRHIADWGREGSERQRVLVRYENDRETFRREEEAWVAREPTDRVIEYGTEIVERTEQTPAGEITYWRKLRLLATSYNAPTAGKPSSHPLYGITRLGLRARKGIVAVDPTVINLGREVYVQDYGMALAADTGGAIKGQRIDLCYDDDNLVLWRRWVDVYLLAPPPDPSKISWTIPDWPREKE